MKRFICSILVIIGVFGAMSANAACTSNQIDILGNGTQCQDVRFSIQTTSDAPSSISFVLSAIGTFYVDCDGGSLMGTGVSGKTITRTSNSVAAYRCDNIGGARTIKFSGKATGYNTTTSIPAFAFYYMPSSGTQVTDSIYITEISGDLSAMFPYVSAAPNAQPRFYRAFYGATHLTSIPGTLFSNYNTTASYMFNGTFSGCTGLTSIPANLFSRITTAAINTFQGTFNGCTGITSIPAGLFSGIKNAATYMFQQTFYGCTGLAGTYVPPTTFAGLTDNHVASAKNMWRDTFGNTGMATNCNNYLDYITGYEGSDPSTTWNGKVSCIDADDTMTVTYSCGDGTGTPPASGTATYNSTFTPASGTGCTYGDFGFTGWKVSGTNTVVNSAFTWPYAESKTLVAQYQNSKFAIKTTNLSNGDTFNFTMTAVGTFTVDCGENGTLSSSAGDVSGNTITRTGTTSATYTCEYSVGGSKTILFDGLATNYSTTTTVAAISFSSSSANSAKIDQISGDLSAIFPYLPNTAPTAAQPRFNKTFKGASNLTSIPGTLFSNYTMGANYMFADTFSGCTSLTSIPAELFSRITTGAAYMFANTFYGCTGLTSIPGDLFGNIVIGGQYEFSNTFYGCTGLTAIPEGLFRNVIIVNTYLFAGTFQGCTNITGYIPPSTFAGLVEYGSPASDYMWRDTFKGTQLVTNCADILTENLTQYTTGYEGTDTSKFKLWNGYVSCEPAPITCNPGQYLPANSETCASCPANSYCYGGGTYILNPTTAQGLSGTCPVGYPYSVAGSDSEIDCYRTCTTADVAHSANVTGYYYSNESAASNSCEPTSTNGCVSGYSYVAGETFNLNNIIPQTVATGYGYRNPDGTWGYSNSEFGVVDNGVFVVENNGHIVWGNAQCSSLGQIVANNQITTSQTLPDATGDRCWCQLAGYQNYNTYTERDISAPWLLLSVYNSASTCASTCAYACYNTVYYAGTSRTMVFDASEEYTPAYCEVTPYNIIYNMNGGTNYAGAPTGYAYGVGAIIDGTPTNSGYIFGGWCTDSAMQNCAMTQTIGTTATGDKTFYAKWVFSITYELDGGTNYAGAPTSYAPGESVTIDGTPTKSGATFGGWCTDSAMQNCAMTQTIGAVATGNKTFYAKWVYTVSYNCNGGTGTVPATTTVAMGEQFQAAANTCTKSDAIFIGWSVSNTGTPGDVKQAEEGFQWNYNEGKTLTAKWHTGGFVIRTTNIPANASFDFKMTAIGTFTVDCGGDGILTGTAGVSGNTITRSDTTVGQYHCVYTTAGEKAIAFGGTATGYSTSIYDPAIDFYEYNSYAAAAILSVEGNMSSVFPYISANAADGAQPRFYQTFRGATNLRTVPDTLFANYTTGSTYMFVDTFVESGLTTIPAGLFNRITTPAEHMFGETFAGCTSLTSIPAGLFSGMTTGAEYLFNQTFSGCTSLTSIPAGLFSGITNAAQGLFAGTFNDCTNLGGYIPPTTFAGLIANNSPLANNMWYYTFRNTNVATSCSSYPGMFQYFTGYEGSISNSWATRVSCIDTISCPAGMYLPAQATTCSLCPANSYCAGGTFNFNQSAAQGVTGQCSDTYPLSDAGSDAATDCYRACTENDVTNLATGGTMSGRYYANNTNTCAPANDQQCATGYSYIAGGFNPDLGAIIGTGETTVTGSGFIDGYGESTTSAIAAYAYNGVNNATAYGLTEDNTFAVNYGTGKGMIKGRGMCTTQVGTNNNGTWSNPTISQTLPNERDNQCYCRLESYIPDGGSPVSISTPWVFMHNNFMALEQSGNDEPYYGCATSCAAICQRAMFSSESGAMPVLFSLGPTFPATCEAATYTVSYDCNGGTGTAPVNGTATYNSAFTAAANTCTKTEHVFAGWGVGSASGTTWTNGTTWEYTENKTFYAKWTANTYNITYTMDGGTNYVNAPTTYTYGTGATISGTPTKTNYVFAGWCTDSELETCAMSQTIATDATGDKTFYAKWTACDACTATNASCTLTGVENNLCTYTTACNEGYYDIQNDGAYNASCSECGGNEYYCTGGVRNSVTSGYYSTGGTATTRTGQSACGGNNYYCSGGVRSSVSSGYYSTGGTETTRTGQSPCTGATYCIGGVQNNCPAGYDADIGLAKTAETQCKIAVSGGHYVGTANQTSSDFGTCTATQYKEPHLVQYASTSSCRSCPSGYTANTATGKSAVSQCQITCAAGNYMATGTYTQVEYLQSTGTQYIDTMFVPKSDFKHTIVFELTSDTPDSNQYVCGTGTSGGRGGNVRINASRLNNIYIGQSATSLISARTLSGKTTLVMDLRNNAKNTILLNGQDIANNSKGTVTSNGALTLFGSRSGIATGVRIYSSVIEQNGEVVKNLVPVRRNSDDELGMLDLISGTFYTNAGTGTFIAGPDADIIAGTCISAGTGYWAAETTVGYGTPVSRTQCPEGYRDGAACAAQSGCIMNVSANNYVAIANDSTAMACSIGYNKAAHSVTYGDTSSCDANVIIINWDDADGNIFETNSCTYDGSITTPTTSPTKRGHAFTGWTFVGQ